MKEFNPITEVENSHLILDNGEWPNFHDAEILNINIWGGDIRPDDNVYIGPQLEIDLELCALMEPYIVTLKFYDCSCIDIGNFIHQNSIYYLEFEFEERGFYKNSEPLPPHIVVKFTKGLGAEITLKCFRIEAIGQREIENNRNV